MKHLWFFILALAALIGCGGGGGGTSGGGGGTVLDPTPFIGSWTGNWNNLTYSTTGPASMTFGANTTTKAANWTMDLDGNVFGGPNPPADNLVGSYTDSALSVTGSSPTFGTLSFTVDKNGNVTGGSTTVPGGFVQSITYSGTITPTSMNLTYVITFVNPAIAPANGTLIMTKSTGATFAIAPLLGTYNGTWSDNNTGTGTTSLQFQEPSTGTATVIWTLTGNPFGTANPADDAWTGLISTSGVTMSSLLQTHGPLSITLNANGTLTGSMSNIPGSMAASATFSGTYSASSIVVNYVITLEAGGTINGTLSATK
ncbi:MAG: hypothetical protein JNM85_03710 [Chthonomonas sp.]|nr:hypothetical protein [Chthonomonas sp.]